MSSPRRVSSRPVVIPLLGLLLTLTAPAAEPGEQPAGAPEADSAIEPAAPPTDAPATTPAPDPALLEALQDRLDQARLLVGQQRYPEAITAFRAYLELAPDDLQARLELARVFSWTQAFDDALALYDALLKALPEDPEIELERARVLLWALRYDEAISALEALRHRHAPVTTEAAGEELSFSPALASQGPDALAERIDRALADGYAWSGRMDMAIPLYERLWDLHPEDRTLGLNYARALSSRRSYASALEVYDQLMDPETSDPPFRLERARVMLWAERYPDGVTALLELRGQLQEPAPAGPLPAGRELLDEVSRLLAAGYAWSGDHAKAAQEYGVLVAEHPQDADLKLELARVLRDLKYYDAALSQYARYLEMRPRDLMAEIERTRVALWAGRYPESIRSFLKLRERLVNPEKSDEITDAERKRYLNEVDRQLARAYLWSGRPMEALPHLRALVAATPDDVQLTYDLARALAQAGRLEEARESYAHYQAMGGTAASAALGEGQTYQWEGDLLRARRAWLRALEQTSDRAGIEAALAAIEPELRTTGTSELKMRADGMDHEGSAGGLQLFQRTLSARGELPYGLLWVAPSIDLDWFSAGEEQRVRVTPAARVRYRHDARWSVRGDLGLEATTAESPVTLRLGAEGRYSPLPTLRLDLGTRFGDAVDTLFSWGSLAERFRQLEASATASWTPLLEWQVWGQARAARLFKPSRQCSSGELCANGFSQLQGALDRGFALGRPRDRLQVGLTAGIVHFSRQDADQSYWSPSLYATIGPRVGVGLELPRDLQLRLRTRGALAYDSDVARFFPEITGELAAEQRLGERIGWRVDATYGRTVRLDAQGPSSPGSYWSTLIVAQGWYRF